MNIGLIGATGKMGKTVYEAFKNHNDYKITAALARDNIGKDLGLVLENKSFGVLIKDKLQDLVDKVDVFLDFSSSEFILNNIDFISISKIPIVIGSTGYSKKDLNYFEKLTLKHNSTIFVIPNFSIGAVLSILFAQKAAKFFKDIEIIEYHHKHKLDAPSGTALLTAKQLLEIKECSEDKKDSVEKVKGVRGGKVGDIHIHSIRLPSLVAHQEILFSDDYQLLTIRHDSFSRKSFIKGIEFVLSKISHYKGFVYGMQTFMEELI